MELAFAQLARWCEVIDLNTATLMMISTVVAWVSTLKSPWYVRLLACIIAPFVMLLLFGVPPIRS